MGHSLTQALVMLVALQVEELWRLGTTSRGELLPHMEVQMWASHCSVLVQSCFARSV